MPFSVGHAKVGGRQKGTPNKATRSFKEFVHIVTEDPEAQQAVVDAIKAGRVDSFFRAAEHAFGKPTQKVEHKGEMRMIGWPDSEDISEE